MIKNIIREFIKRNPVMAKGIATLCYSDEKTGEFALSVEGVVEGIVVFTNIPKTHTTFEEWLKCTIADHVFMAVTKPLNNPTLESLSQMIDCILGKCGVVWDMAE